MEKPDVEEEFFSLEDEFWAGGEIPVLPRKFKSDADDETSQDSNEIRDHTLDWLKNLENNENSQSLQKLNLKKPLRKKSLVKEEEEFKSESPNSNFKFNLRIDSFFKKKQIEPRKEEQDQNFVPVALSSIKRYNSNENIFRKRELQSIGEKREGKKSVSPTPKRFFITFEPDDYEISSFSYQNFEKLEKFEWEFLFNKKQRQELEKLQELFSILEEENFLETKNLLYDDDELLIENPLFEKGKIEEEDEILEEFINPFYKNGNSLLFPQDWEFNRVLSLVKFLKTQIKLEKVEIGSMVYKRCFSGSTLLETLKDSGGEYVSIPDCKYVLTRLYNECWISSIPYNSNMEFESSSNYYYCFIEDDKHSDIINHTEITYNIKYTTLNWVIGHPREPYNMAMRIENILEKLYDECINYEEGYIDFKTIINNGWLRTLNYESYYLRKIDFNDLIEKVRKPIFLNLYNLIFLHYCISKRIPNNQMEYEEMLNLNCYMIGKYKFSMTDIRNLLRGITKIAHPYLNNLSFQNFDPRIHFCLSGPFKTSPLPRLFTMLSCEKEIQEATTRYITTHTKLHIELNELSIPPIFTENKIDFSFEVEDICDLIYLEIDKKKQKDIDRMKLNNKLKFHKFWSNFDWTIKRKDETSLTFDGVSFDSLIQNPKFREIFKVYCKSEFSIENVLFWEAVQDFKNIAVKNINSQTLVPHLLIDKSRLIYKEFLKRNSNYELNVEQNQVNAVYNIINVDNPNLLNDISIHLFDDIEKSIVLVMNDTFMRFQMKKEYELFMKELNRQKLH